MSTLRMPTIQEVGRNSHAASIKDFNGQMRQQPWYQQWFQQQGLDPNHVKLSKQQRSELEQLVLKNGGVPSDAFNDMEIDPAGNLNTEHGFASQPTWLKALEIGGVAAGGAFAAPGSIGSLVGMGGGGAPGSVAGFTPAAASSGMAASAPSLAGLGALPAVGAGAGATAPVTAAVGDQVASKAGGIKGLLGKVFGKGGIDPTSALLSGLSLFGGDGQPNSFKGTGADPVKTMTDTLGMIDQLSQKVTNRGPSQLRSPLSPNGMPAPVSIPGVPFQIGGALGSDPSIPADPAKAKLRNS